jgi:hypothetical protein
MDDRAGSDPLFKVLIVLTVMMGMVILGVGYMILRPVPDDRQAPSPGRCDALGSEEESCGAEEWCIRGRCQPRPALQYAKRGESCRDRACEPPHFTCGDDKTCHQIGSPLPPPPHCDDPQVIAAVEQLAAKCSQRQQDITMLAADPLSCSPEIWSTLLASDNEIDVILSAFPDRFALVFPPGQPRKRGSFPDESEQEFLVAQLRPFKPRITQAHKIFVIGRESPDGGSNRDLTLRRIDAFQNSIRVLLEEGSAPSADLPKPAYVSWGMDGKHILTLPNFVTHYVGQHQPFAYSEKQQNWVRDGITKFQSGAKLSGYELDELEKAINRVVLVIPILCDPRKDPE